jgi:outer membrane protein OmpA-like peptidoglycan-associated protein
MLRRIVQCAIFILLCSGFAAADKLSDRPGFKDTTLFTRMPHYYLVNPNAVKEQQYDFCEFKVTKDNKTVTQRVEGHKLIYLYEFDRSAGAPPSGLQIARNYQNAVLKIGGEVLYDGASHRDSYDRMTFRLTKEGKEIWAEVMNEGIAYYLTIVERQAMQQDVAANADALRDGLARNGHVEVPGIFFDFAKSDIKPESEPALKELAKLLGISPSLKVWVVGHTDNVGSAESNVTLSRARAAAVVKALTGRFNINAVRLAAQGVGPFAPVATNTTDEGRARNRRVELVAQQ